MVKVMGLDWVFEMRTWEWVALAFIIPATMIATFGDALGKAEGWLMPVVAPATIDTVAPVGDVRSRIGGTLVRNRVCHFLAVEFRLHSPSGYSVVDVVIEETSKVRDQGASRFGPWVVHLTQEQFPRATAVAFHRCHGLWDTQTTFYLGGQE